MNDCFIVGSGRSGTSMVAGLLARSGYYMGGKLDAYRGVTNPKGFFEDPDINAINEQILQPIVPRRPREPIGRVFFPRRGVAWSHWLTPVAPEVEVPRPPPALVEWIRTYTDTRPFCFKDPRFSYTLSIWREQAPHARFICVFREPSRTAHSMVKEANGAEYLRHFKLDYRGALRVWEAMYLRILNEHAREGEWLFVHYDQALNGDAFDRLEEFTGARLDRTFPEESLSRSPASGDVSTRAIETYRRLCERAGFASAA
jgi:Sulfotransferase family